MPEPVIRVRDLGRKFGTFKAVDGVSFEVAPGEIFGYLGANGAGKSTTIRMLCGLLRPTSGEARVAGVDVVRDPEGVKRAIGYMSQRFSLYLDLSVDENLEFFGGAFGLWGRRLRARAEELLQRVELTDQREALTGSMPGGFRQRLALACAMLHAPQILFLDEPTAGVDPKSRRTFWRLIRELSQAGTTIFVTTHYMDEAEYCDRVGLMVEGRLEALDTPAGLKRTHIPGRMVRIKGAVRQAVLGLLSLPGVLSVEPFGASYHVQIADSGPKIGALLGRLPGATAEDVDATLEDVFLRVVGAPGKH